MDPLSIATGAAALAKFAYSASTSIYACIEEIKSADANLLQLQSEVKALQSGLESVATSFKSDEVVQLFSRAKAQGRVPQSVKQLKKVKPLLSDCKSTLKSLSKILESVAAKPKYVPETFRMPVQAIKINFKAKDVVSIRHQIRSYSSAMRMTLHMVTMCISIDGNMEAEIRGARTNEQLDVLISQQATLAKQISELQDNLSETIKTHAADDGGSYVPADSQRSEKEQHLKEYLSSADVILSSASNYAESISGTVVGMGSDDDDDDDDYDDDDDDDDDDDVVSNLTARYGSVMGLNTDQKERIGDWINGEQLFEEDEETDSDAELDMSLFKARLAVAQNHLQSKDYMAAELQLKQCVANTAAMDSLPPHTAIDVKFDLASASRGCGSLVDEQAILIELLQHDMEQPQVVHLHHCLAVSFAETQELEKAHKYAKSAMKGCKKLHGRYHHFYHDAIRLLVDICKAQNNHSDAEAYGYMLKESRRGESPQPSRPVATPTQDAHALNLLSERGFDIDSKETFFDALEWAHTSKHSNVVQLLLRHGSDVRQRAMDGKTILMYAVMGGYEDIVVRLLRQGADANATQDEKENIGHTALYYAADSGNEAMVRLLLDNGALPDLPGHDYGKIETFCSPLEAAAFHGDQHIVDLLLRHGANPNAMGFQAETALHVAAVSGELEIIRLLLDHGAAIDQQDEHGFTALFYAVSFASEFAATQLLLDRGASVDQPNQAGTTPLMDAASFGYKSIAELLLDRGAVIDLLDGKGRTALMKAAGGGRKDLVELLFDRGASTEYEDGDGWTPLMLAAHAGETAMVELLLKMGARKRTKNNQGESASSLAMKGGFREIVEILEDTHGSTPLKNKKDGHKGKSRTRKTR